MGPEKESLQEISKSQEGFKVIPDQPGLPSGGTVFVHGEDSRTITPEIHSDKARPLKTPRMLEVERKFATPRGEKLEEMLYRMNSVDGMGSHRIGKEIDVSATSVLAWMRRLDMQRTPHPDGFKAFRHDPVVEERRIASLRAAWAKRGEEIIAKRMASGWSESVKAGLKSYWDAHPEEREEQARKSREAHARRKAANTASRFGDNPQETLRRLVEVEGFRVDDIAQRIRASKETARKAVAEYKVILPRKRPKITKGSLEQRRGLVQAAQQAGLLSQLSLKQQEVIRALYPPEGQFPTQSAIAGNMAKSRAYISYIDKIALDKLEKLLKGEFVERRGRQSKIDQRLGDDPQETDRKRSNEVEIALGENPREILNAMFNEQKLTLKEVAEKLECSYQRVRLKAIEWGISYPRWKRSK